MKWDKKKKQIIHEGNETQEQVQWWFDIVFVKKINKDNKLKQ